MRRLCLSFGLAAALFWAGSAAALSISAVSATKNAGNTADQDYGPGLFGTDGEWLSTATVTDSGGTTPDGIGNFVTAATRYAAVLWADNENIPGDDETAATDTDYSVSFTVSAPAAVTYDVTIATSRVGTLILDGTIGIGVSQTADISAVSGSSSVAGSGSLNLADVAGISTTTGDDTEPFNQSSLFTIAGLSGLNLITLTFVWDQDTYSNDGEACVLLGLGGTNSDTDCAFGAADPDFGHFVDITAEVTAVPEPGAAALLGLGLWGLAALGSRARR
jgi:hypothetical protein